MYVSLFPPKKIKNKVILSFLEIATKKVRNLRLYIYIYNSDFSQLKNINLEFERYNLGNLTLKIGSLYCNIEFISHY